MCVCLSLTHLPWHVFTGFLEGDAVMAYVHLQTHTHTHTQTQYMYVCFMDFSYF